MGNLSLRNRMRLILNLGSYFQEVLHGVQKITRDYKNLHVNVIANKILFIIVF